MTLLSEEIVFQYKRKIKYFIVKQSTFAIAKRIANNVGSVIVN